MYIFTRSFWSYAGERAIKTFAQTAIALLTVTGVATPGFEAFDWIVIGSATGVATLLSILTAIANYDAAKTVNVVETPSSE